VEDLEPVDNSTIEYAEFAKDFYDEAPEVAALTDAQVEVVMGGRVGTRVEGRC
jgi:hypothetical protein